MNYSKIETFSSLEMEIIQLVARGFEDKDIARQLNLSQDAFDRHLNSIYGKLRVEDRLNLIIVAYQKGLIEFGE